MPLISTSRNEADSTSRPFSFQINRIGIRFKFETAIFPSFGRGFDSHRLPKFQSHIRPTCTSIPSNGIQKIRLVFAVLFLSLLGLDGCCWNDVTK
jgi:hypothetical protein